jgi:protein ImuB
MNDARLLVLWCPDWPAVAAATVAGLPAHVPVAVVVANRVVACSAPARVDGVRRGTRRRDAQSRCPGLVVVEPDPDRDARLFEPVAAAVEELAPGVEVVRPGVVAVPARGPVGYFGGPERAAEQMVDHVAAHTGVECQVGVADGLFAALLAARRGVVVPIGATPEFLAPLGIGELDQSSDRFGLTRSGVVDTSDRAELVDLLHRLGIRTLGAFAALPERDVASRFGGDAVLAHRLAGGRAERPLDRRTPPPDLVVDLVLDPPADRVDTAAFAARTAAQRFYTLLAERGLACTRLAIHVRTEAGEERSRVWRCAEPLTMAGIADRVRWQLDGWLRTAAMASRDQASRDQAPGDQAPGDQERGGTAGSIRPSAGVSLLRLSPEEVIDGRALQFGLWAGAADPSEETERAGRALVRVQGLLGPEGVCTAVLGGGRGPADQVRLVPWGDERVPSADREPPWPGRLPAPSPATVPVELVPALVTDAEGAEVGVTGRHLLTAIPHQVEVPGVGQRRVRGWAGPWPVVERWWDTTGSERRAARLQVLLTDAAEPNAAEPNAAGLGAAGLGAAEPELPGINPVGNRPGEGDAAVLLLREGGRWLVEGMYD